MPAGHGWTKGRHQEQSEPGTQQGVQQLPYDVDLPANPANQSHPTPAQLPWTPVLSLLLFCLPCAADAMLEYAARCAHHLMQTAGLHKEDRTCQNLSPEDCPNYSTFYTCFMTMQYKSHWPVHTLLTSITRIIMGGPIIRALRVYCLHQRANDIRCICAAFLCASPVASEAALESMSASCLAAKAGGGSAPVVVVW